MDKPKEQEPIQKEHPGPHGESCQCPNTKYTIVVDFTHPEGTLIDLVGEKPQTYDHAVLLVTELRAFVDAMVDRLYMTKIEAVLASLQKENANAASDQEVS